MLTWKQRQASEMIELQSESWKQQVMIIPPNRSKSISSHVPNHPHHIPIQMRTKTETLIIPTQSVIPATKLPISSFPTQLHHLNLNSISITSLSQYPQIQPPPHPTHTKYPNSAPNTPFQAFSPNHSLPPTKAHHVTLQHSYNPLTPEKHAFP